MPEELPAWWTWSIFSTQWYFSSATSSKPASAPIWAKRRLEAGQPLDAMVSGRISSSWSRTVRPLRSLTGTIGVGEVAVGPRLGGAVVRLGGERVDVVAGPALEGGDQVGADALRHEAGGRARWPGRTAQAPPSEPIGTRLIDSTPPARIRSSKPERTRGAAWLTASRPGGAEAVELDAGDGLRVAGRERGGLGDVATLLADRGDDAEHDVVDAVRVQAGVAGLDSSRRPDHQVDRLHLVQGADRLALAARRADVVVHECFCHDRPSCAGGMR